MLHENIKNLRKAIGLSQSDLAERVNVVRQTVSKWETGASVPDAEMIIVLSDALGVPVSTLLGENVDDSVAVPNDISAKLEQITRELARRKANRRTAIRISLIALAALTAILFALLAVFGSPYESINSVDIESAVVAVGLHSLEWVFVRIAPIVFIGAIVGAVLTKR